jgi:hypothetical protein
MQNSSRLRYLDADEVGSEVVDFDDLKVRTRDGDKLGEVDGFIVDSDARRAYYVVVDSGGWFSSRRFLVPIGHARVDDDGDALVLDVSRDTISRYPEFDRDSFDRLSDDELRSYQQRYGEACCPDEAAATTDWNYDAYKHYRQPAWWRAEFYAWDAPAAVGTTGTIERDRGRAQPGDVLGIETGGETTAIGEDAEDENERRRDAGRVAGRQVRDKD